MKVSVKNSSSSNSIIQTLLIVLLVIGIGALIYWLIKKYQKKKVEVVEELKSPI